MARSGNTPDSYVIRYFPVPNLVMAHRRFGDPDYLLRMSACADSSGAIDVRFPQEHISGRQVSRTIPWLDPILDGYLLA